MERFEVAFRGQLTEGATLAQAKANLAKLFQADENRLAILFSGKRVVIKSDIDHATAEKYRTLMARAGVVAEVLSLTPEIEEIELTAVPESPRYVAQAPEQKTLDSSTPDAAQAMRPELTDDVVVRDEYMQAFVHVKAPNYGIAPVGVDLQDAKPEVTPKPLDLSALSLAPVGADMGEIPRDQQAPEVDISHLKISE